MDRATFGEVAARLVAGTAPIGPSGSPPAGVAVSLRSDRLHVDAVAGLRTVATPATSAAPLTVGTFHDLASVTKVMATTAALMALVSARQIGLDDAVHRYLPNFGDGAKADVTVRDLLAHRGGLREWHPVYVATSDREAADELVDRLPLRYQPCTAKHYSDLGFMLLGRIIAVAAAMPLEEPSPRW